MRESTIIIEKGIRLEMLANLHVLSQPENEKVVIGMPSVCMCVAYLLHATAWADIHIRYVWAYLL
jgi:hypothetical protein